MGRLQSSIGLITGTNIVGTVDQLINISAQPRNRLLNTNKEIQGKQQQIAALTASVIGVQLAGNGLAAGALFSSKNVSSSNTEAISATAGENVQQGKYTVRTLQTAATHTVTSAQKFEKTDEALGLTGKIVINPSGFVDDKVQLRQLNEGLGVEAGSIRVTDRSGKSADVDLSSARTVDDVLQAINDADVAITATTRNGKIRLTDTSGSTASNLKVQQVGSGETAADLGLWNIDQASNVVDGKSIDLPDGVQSLRGAALSQLGGGAGLGSLGQLSITLSDNSTANIDLSETTSLSEVVDAINQSGLQIIARVNDAGNGLRLRDVSGGTGSFSIASDATSTALGLNGTVSGDIASGRDLNFKSVSRDTKLADLNQGTGPTRGSFTITDSAGKSGAINLVSDEITTLGGLIDKINGLSIDVEASINEKGDGIVLTNTASGTGSLVVVDTGSGTVAKSLGIAGTAAANKLTGTDALSIDVTAEDTLESIVEKINDADRYADASIVADNGTYSLQIRSKKGGEAGRIGVNVEGLDLDLRTFARGQDAVIAIGREGSAERFVSSTDGVFNDEVSGLNLTVKNLSKDPVTINVDKNPDAVITAVKRFADQFNKLVDKVNEVTIFDAEKNEVGLLFGSTETLRITTGYANLLSSNHFSGSEFRSLSQIGVRLDDKGKLKVDESKLKEALERNSEGVEQLLVDKDPDTKENRGIIGKLDRLADRLAGTKGGMLLNKTQTLTTQIERNGQRVDGMNQRLDAERERLLKQYYAMEEAIGKLRNNQQYASQISYIGAE